MAFNEGTYGSFEYGRYGNPTTHVVEEKLAALEGAETALVSSSGMNSATTMLLALVPAGEAGLLMSCSRCLQSTLWLKSRVTEQEGTS